MSDMIDSLDDRALLFRADNSAIYKMLENAKIDHVMTDPPYDAFTHRGAATKSVHVRHGHAFSVEFDSLKSMQFVRQSIIIAKGWALFFCSLEMLGTYQAEAPNRYVRGAYWDRVNSAPQISGDRPAQAGEGIAIFHATRRNMKWNGGGKAGVFRHQVEHGKKVHPTQKPLNLMVELVNLFSQPDEVIFDPFMGSGTTGVAALMSGRRFIGVERDEGYYQIARERIAEAASRRPIWAEKPKPVKLIAG